MRTVLVAASAAAMLEIRGHNTYFIKITTVYKVIIEIGIVSPFSRSSLGYYPGNQLVNHWQYRDYQQQGHRHIESLLVSGFLQKAL